MSEEIPISERIEKAPWWVPCVLCFCAGLAIPLAMLVTVNATPDFKRGHDAGYSMRDAEAKKQLMDMQREAMYNGALIGWQAHARGEPFPIEAPK